MRPGTDQCLPRRGAGRGLWTADPIQPRGWQNCAPACAVDGSFSGFRSQLLRRIDSSGPAPKSGRGGWQIRFRSRSSPAPSQTALRGRPGPSPTQDSAELSEAPNGVPSGATRGSHGGPSPSAMLTIAHVVTAVPGKVTGVAPTPLNGAIDIVWNRPTGPTSYRIEWESGSQVYAVSNSRTVSGGGTTSDTRPALANRTE